MRAPSSILPVTSPTTASEDRASSPTTVGDAGEGDHPLPVADLGDQPAHVCLEEVVEPLVHPRRAPSPPRP